jgi:type IV pilus assembly protein PilW
MIALLIGVFLLGALLTIVQTNRAVFGDQNKLAQLQDGERMAMTMMSDVIQSAGYFPAPVAPSVTSQAMALPVSTAFGATYSTATQSITGIYQASAQGDQLSVRYMTASGDNVLNCSGTSNTTGANTLYVNTFEVLIDANGVGQLVCIMNGQQYDLVSGVTNLSVLYGVKQSATAPGNSADTYMTANDINTINPTLWTNVISVMVQLTFTNPMYNAANPGPLQPTITVQRVIGVMNQSGPMT